MMENKQTAADAKAEVSMSARDLKPLPPVPNSNPSIRPSSLFSILPPAIGVLGMTPELKRQQTFPYSMSATDGTKVYLSTVALASLFFHIQSQILESGIPYSLRDSLTAFFVWWVYFLQFRIGIYSCVYPFVYACLLRARDGECPSRIQVLGSSRAKEMELERGGEMRRGGVFPLLGLWVSYTWAGCVVMEAWGAWKEGLGQEEFVREKRMRELEEARAKVVEEEKKIGDRDDEKDTGDDNETKDERA
ncbi:hypothetical protein ONS96_014395 [Cadophora gregata f. sp. sojae]|nr:hypothetical protein ONS96_014395 [Cadophora gregata f. sp. sojae]